MGIAVYALPTLSTPSTLDHFNEVSVLKLNIRGRMWVVLGKAVIHNRDGDAQNASLHLREVGAPPGIPEIDSTSVRIPEKTAYSLTVQGTAVMFTRPEVELVCATYKGYVTEASLIAIEVDSTHKQPP